jgi:hypothetical protein
MVYTFSKPKAIEITFLFIKLNGKFSRLFVWPLNDINFILIDDIINDKKLSIKLFFLLQFMNVSFSNFLRNWLLGMHKFSIK